LPSSCKLANENDNFNKLVSIDMGAVVSMRCPIIPHLPLGSSPMLSINDTNAVEVRQDHPQVSKLENHRKDLETELDNIKQETINLFSEITCFSEENSNLEEQNKLLNKKIEIGNVLANGLQKVSKKVSIKGEKQEENQILNIDQCENKEGYISTSYIFVNSENEYEEKDEISKLKSKIFELEENMKIVEEKYESDKKDLVKKNEQLEQSLELMKQEFESMEDYWQGKIDNERRFYEDQITTSGEQFKELEDRLKEYIGFIEPDNEKPNGDIEALYTIDEACSMELQVAEWEEEILQLKLRNEQLCEENKATVISLSGKVKDLEHENTVLLRKCTDLSELVEKELYGHVSLPTSLLCWCKKRSVSHSGLQTSSRPNFRIGTVKGPHTHSGRIAQLRKYLQQDFKSKRNKVPAEDNGIEISSRSLDYFDPGDTTVDQVSLHFISM